MRQALVVLAFAIALAQLPATAGPTEHLAAGYFLGEVHALEPRPVAGLLKQRLDVELPLCVMRYDAIRGTLDADLAGERARVDAGKADAAIRLQPGIEALGTAEITWRRDVIANDAAQSMRIV